jgi:2-oxoacid dehydrogenases acyltransferase (catalytic domain)/Transposase domain (DUF772)
MRPKERRETGQTDLLRSRLDAIIDMNHALVKLSQTIDWSFLEEKFGAVYEDKPGRPPLPTRLMAGLAILKHTYDLSDEVLCERWVENPYYQFFCGEEFFQHRLVLDRSSLTRWRQRMGEEKLQALLQESLSVAAKTEAIKPSDLNRVIVDTTVQPKNVMFPAGRDVSDLRAGLDRLRADAIARSIPPEELCGATITLSNFGMIGGRLANLVIVPPQTAIVGAGRISQRVVAHRGQPAVRRLLPLSLTFDHRVVTGGEAARFLVALKLDLERLS